MCIEVPIYAGSGGEVVTVESGSAEWHDESDMLCKDCGYNGIAAEFYKTV